MLKVRLVKLGDAEFSWWGKQLQPTLTQAAASKERSYFSSSLVATVNRFHGASDS